MNNLCLCGCGQEVEIKEFTERLRNLRGYAMSLKQYNRFEELLKQITLEIIIWESKFNELRK